MFFIRKTRNSRTGSQGESSRKSEVTIIPLADPRNIEYQYRGSINQACTRKCINRDDRRAGSTEGGGSGGILKRICQNLANSSSFPPSGSLVVRSIVSRLDSKASSFASSNIVALFFPPPPPPPALCLAPWPLAWLLFLLKTRPRRFVTLQDNRR